MTRPDRQTADPAAALDDLQDGLLLERFLNGADQAAFTILVRRHGPMVLGACRRVLANAADADDAFQTVFLVLLRKANELRGRETLGNWLYGVAFHTALKARALAMKRRAKELAARVRRSRRRRPRTWLKQSTPNWPAFPRNTVKPSSFATWMTCPARLWPKNLGFQKERCRAD